MINARIMRLHRRYSVLMLLALAGCLKAPAHAQFVDSTHHVGYVKVEIRPGLNLIANPLLSFDNTVAALFDEVPDGTILYKLNEEPQNEGMEEALAIPLESLRQQLPTDVPAPLTLTVSPPNLRLEWTGLLQAADEVRGPFVTMSQAISPLVLAPTVPARFWRARAPLALDLSRLTANRIEFGEWTHPDETLVPGEGALLFNPSSTSFTLTFVGEIMEGHLTNPIPAGLSIRSSMVPQEGNLGSRLLLPLALGDHVFLWVRDQLQSFTLLPDRGWTPAEPDIQIGQSFFIYAHKSNNWVQTLKIPD